MKISYLLAVFIIGLYITETCADNSKAIKYLSICLKKPTTRYIDRLCDTWEGDKNLTRYLRNKFDKTGNPSYLRILAGVYEKEGRDSKALELCNKLLQKNPDKPELLLLKARLEFFSYNPENAAAQLEKALKCKTLSSALQLRINKLLGQVYLRLEKEKEALNLWKQLYKNNKNQELGDELLQLMLDEGLYSEAINFCQSLIEDTRSPFRQNELNIRMAEICVLKGDRKEAVRLYAETLAKSGRGSWLEKELYARICRLYRENYNLKGLIQFTKDFQKQSTSRPELTKKYIGILYENGDIKQALAEYRRLIKAVPLSQRYRKSYAKMLEKSGNYKAAASVYQQLLKDYPEDHDTLWSLGMAELRQKNQKAAINYFKKYLEKNSDDEYACIRIAALFEKEGLTKYAADIYKNMYEHFPKRSEALEAYSSWLLRQGKTEKAVSLLTSGNDIPLDTMLRRSRLLVSNGQSPNAANFLQANHKRFAANFKFNSELFSLLGTLHKTKKRQALLPEFINSAKDWNELRRAIPEVVYFIKKTCGFEKFAAEMNKKKSLTPGITCLLAEVMKNSGKDAAAEQILAGAIKKQPKAFILYRQQIRMLTASDEISKAAELTKRLLKLDSHRRAECYRSLIELAKRNNNYTEALKWANKYKRDYPNSIEAWTTLAAVQDKAGKNSDALNTLSRASFRYPDNQDLQNLLISAYLKSGDYRGATNACWRLLRKETRLDGKLEILRSIYRISRISNRVDEFKDQIKRIQKTAPKDIFPILALAQIARRENNFSNYRFYLKKAFKLAPENLQLLYQLADLEEEEGNLDSVEYYLRTATRNDSSGNAEMRLAAFYAKYGEERKSFDIFLKQIKRHQNSRTLLYAAASMICRKQPEQALSLLKTTPLKAEDQAKAEFLKGCAFEMLDNYKTAVNCFVKVIKSRMIFKLSQKPVAKLSPGGSPGNIKFLPKETIKLQKLTSLPYRVYSYLQDKRFNSWGGALTSGAAINLPHSPEDAELFSLVHLAKLSNSLEEKQRKHLIEHLEAAGVEYPGFTLLAASGQVYSLDLSTEFKRHQDNPAVMLFLLTSARNAIWSNVPTDKLNSALKNFIKKYPKYNAIVAQAVFSNPQSIDPDLCTALLEKINSQKDVPFQVLLQLAYALINNTDSLKPSQQKLIVGIIERHLKSIDKLTSNPQFQSLLPMSLSCYLIKKGKYEKAANVFKLLLNQQLKPAPSAVSGFSYNKAGYNYGKKQLALAPLQFPFNELTIIPTALVIFKHSMLRLLNDEQKKKFLEALGNTGNNANDLALAGMLKQTKIANKYARKITDDKASTLPALAQAAAWFGLNNQPEKAISALVTARKYALSRANRKVLNSAIAGYALMLPQSAERMNYIRQTAKNLLRLKLTFKEKASLASALQTAGLEKEAEKLDKALLKNASSHHLINSSSSISSTAKRNSDPLKRAQKYLEKDQRHQAVKLIAQLYRRELSSINGRSFSKLFYSRSSKKIFALVKNNNLKKDFLKILKPDAMNNTKRQIEYGWACYLLEDYKEAEKNLLAAFEKQPANSLTCVMLLSAGFAGKMHFDVDKLAEKIKLSSFILMGNQLYSLFKKPEDMVKFYRLFTEIIKRTKDIRTAVNINQHYLLNTILTYPEKSRIRFLKGKSIKSVFEYAAAPKKYSKDKIYKKILKAYSEMLEQYIRFPELSVMAFDRKLLLCKLRHQDTDKLFDEALKVIKLNSGKRLYILHNSNNKYFKVGNKQITMPDFDAYTIGTAIKLDRLSDLYTALKKTQDGLSKIKQIKKIKELQSIPESQFITTSQQIFEEFNSEKRKADLLNLIINTYNTRKLKCDIMPLLTPFLDRLVKEQNSYVYVMPISNFVSICAENNNSKPLLEVLRYCCLKMSGIYKKKFPSRVCTRQALRQAISYNINTIVQTLTDKLLEHFPEQWYKTYQAAKPVINNETLEKGSNCSYKFNNFFRNHKGPKLKESPFNRPLAQINICPFYQSGIRKNLLEVLLQSSRTFNKKLIAELDTQYLPEALVEALRRGRHANVIFGCFSSRLDEFNALPKSSQDEWFTIIQNTIQQMSLSVFNMNQMDKGWKFYKLYKQYLTNNSGRVLAEFKKKTIDQNHYYPYSQKAAALILSLAQSNPETAIKVFEIASKKLKLAMLSASYPTRYSYTCQMLDQMLYKCNRIADIATYYRCMLKTDKINFSMAQNFYNRLRNKFDHALNSKSYGNKDIMVKASCMLKEIIKNFDLKHPPMLYPAISCLEKLNSNQLKQLIIKYPLRENSSPIEKNLAIALKMMDKNKSSKQLSLELHKYFKEYMALNKIPEVMRIAWGMSVIDSGKCTGLAVPLAAPVIKYALHTQNSLSPYQLTKLIEDLYVSPETPESSLASKLVAQFLHGQIYKNLTYWQNRNAKNAAKLLFLCYRGKCNKEAISLLNKAQLKLKKSTNTLIALANAGQVKTLCDFIAKNHLLLYKKPQLSLITKGRKTAETACARLKGEQAFCAKIIFACTNNVIYDDAGNILRHQSKAPRETSIKYAQEFNKIKFTSIKSKQQCLLLLLQSNTAGAKQFTVLKKDILSLPLSKLLKVSDTGLLRQFSEKLINSPAKSFTAKIDEAIKIAGSQNKNAAQARRFCKVLADKICDHISNKIDMNKQARDLFISYALKLLPASASSRAPYFKTAALCYLFGRGTDYIKILQDANRRRLRNLRYSNFRKAFSIFKTCSKQMKFDPYTKFLDFIESKLVTELADFNKARFDSSIQRSINAITRSIRHEKPASLNAYCRLIKLTSPKFGSYKILVSAAKKKVEEKISTASDADSFIKLAAELALLPPQVTNLIFFKLQRTFTKFSKAEKEKLLQKLPPICKDNQLAQESLFVIKSIQNQVSYDELLRLISSDKNSLQKRLFAYITICQRKENLEPLNLILPPLLLTMETECKSHDDLFRMAVFINNFVPRDKVSLAAAAVARCTNREFMNARTSDISLSGALNVVELLARSNNETALYKVCTQMKTTPVIITIPKKCYMLLKYKMTHTLQKIINKHDDTPSSRIANQVVFDKAIENTFIKSLTGIKSTEQKDAFCLIVADIAAKNTEIKGRYIEAYKCLGGEFMPSGFLTQNSKKATRSSEMCLLALKSISSKPSRNSIKLLKTSNLYDTWKKLKK
ncbi:MAG: tetratricopeptide repeat protein [Lentisphaerae bacterium]|nr:tetratricopeptide repeat protein [Lentisphaerota bacterium]MCP4102238.1 tetratricopeptide repeat protein [Lentisphaerota bacterium]